MADRTARLLAFQKKLAEAGYSDDEIKDHLKAQIAGEQPAKPVDPNEPDTYWGGFIKSLLPGGAAFNKATEGGVTGTAERTAAGMAGAGLGVAKGAVGFYPALVMGLVKAGAIAIPKALELMQDPDKIPQAVEELKAKGKDLLGKPIDTNDILAPITKEYQEHPNKAAFNVGDTVGQIYGSVQAAKAGPAVLKFAKDNAKPILNATGQALIKTPKLTQLAGRGLVRIAGQLPEGEAAAAAAEAAPAAGAASAAEAAAPPAGPKPWTMEDMKARAAARAADPTMRPKFKEGPNGPKLTGYLPKETAAERAAAQAAEVAPEESATASKPQFDNGQDMGYTKATPNPDLAITPDEAKGVMSAQDEPAIGAKRVNLNRMKPEDMADLNKFMETSPSEADMAELRRQFGDKSAVETQDALAARARPGAFSLGPAPEGEAAAEAGGAPGAAPATDAADEGDEAFKKAMAETPTPEMSVKGAGSMFPGSTTVADTGGSEVGSMPQQTARVPGEPPAAGEQGPVAPPEGMPEVHPQSGKLMTGVRENKGRGPQSPIFHGHSYTDHLERMAVLAEGASPEEADAAVEAARQQRFGLYRRGEATPQEIYGGSAER